MKHSKECEGCPILTTCSSRESAFSTRTSCKTIVPLVRLTQVVSSYTSVELHDVVFKFKGWIQLCRLEKCISVGRRFRKYSV